MKVSRPPSFIPYGPHGHPAAKFNFECEGPELERVTEKFCEITPDWPYLPPKPGRYAEVRAELALDGYFILPVVEGEVSDSLMATLPVPPQYAPAAPGAPGRRLEHFPYKVAGYYQHYTYEPFTNNNPECDHDFGLESANYVLAESSTGELLPLKQVRLEAAVGIRRVGEVYLTVKCTRCGDLHGLKQVSVNGELDLNEHCD